MSQVVLAAFLVLNQILTAGNTITAFSLLLYALTFNLRERVARAFALLLACVTASYFGDVLVSTEIRAGDPEIWLRLQWLGISFLPAAYLHFSDALLASTGRPSRGRRRLLILLSYVAGGGTFALAGVTRLLAGDLSTADTAVYLEPGILFPLFALYFGGSLAFAGLNLWRSYKRCLTRASRRRMGYLLFGSLGPAFGVFPFLMLSGGRLVGALPLLFWGLLAVINASVTVLIVLMAYAVAYAGVGYPDRVVKARLFQWILRGPVVASTALATTVILNRLAGLVGWEGSRAVPFAMVGVILLLQYVITLVRPVLERWLFYGEDRQDVARLHILEEKLLTTGDLRQFLESVLNAVCDVSGAQSAFIAVLGRNGLELELAVGPHRPFEGQEELPPFLVRDEGETLGALGTVFVWDRYWLIPVRSSDSKEIVGLLGLDRSGLSPSLSSEQEASLGMLVVRAAVALADRVLQREVFGVVDRLMPEVEAIQKMRAAARYGGTEALTAPAQGMHTEGDLFNLVKEALGHYWGGPRLTRSPLLRLQVVREALEQHKGNPVNALRSILRNAIARTRPEGERRFTTEWMLYNILELKFLEGRKVRDVAMRLAMSEADLYRKQKVAIEVVASAIGDMEREAAVRAAGEDDD